MADTVEVRLTEAQSNNLSFSESLSMVIADEIQAGYNRKLQRLLGHDHADPSKSLENLISLSTNATVTREKRYLPLHLYQPATTLSPIGPLSSPSLSRPTLSWADLLTMVIKS